MMNSGIHGQWRGSARSRGGKASIHTDQLLQRYNDKPRANIYLLETKALLVNKKYGKYINGKHNLEI
jgi:hypothetical protein